MSKGLLFSKMIKPALFSLPAETAHNLSIRGLQTGLVFGCQPNKYQSLRTSVAGLEFPNPLGIAAGYDKNAEVPGQLIRLGFGFAEIGTVTPKPQRGNSLPRIFRLENEQAIINRLGFNNEGHEAVLRRLKKRRQNGIFGINIGANKDSRDFIADYVQGIEAFASYASYFTVNISSPNTPGLRDLQAVEVLPKLLDMVLAARDRTCQTGSSPVPVFLKIAPDLTDQELDDIAKVANDLALDGMIVANTTLDRKAVAGNSWSNESGGLSGKPLFNRSTIVLAKMRQRLLSKMPIIGVGGIDGAEAAIAKMEAGADLVQLYTGLIYQGPGLPGKILRNMSRYLKQDGKISIAEIVGRKTDEWANRRQ